MKILLAIDDSEASREPIVEVATRAWPEGSIVRVITVVEPLTTIYPPAFAPEAMVLPPSPTQDELRTHDAEGMVEAVAGMLRDRGVQVQTDVLFGDPKHEIIAEAKRFGADLIIVGSHGRRGIERVLMGSVASWVVKHAPCSVEVARSRAPAEETADRQPS